MGGVILWRALRGPAPRLFPAKYSGPLGFFGGLFDAIGGGGWGPTVATAMVGAGGDPRTSIGTSNTAEFLVTSTISATFLATLLTGHWSYAGNLGDHATAVAGLVAGGLAFVFVRGIRIEILPEAGTLLADVVQPRFGFLLNQALALAMFGNHDQLHVGIHLAFAIPEAACGADLDLGRQY